MGNPPGISIVNSHDRAFTDAEVRGFHDLIHEPEQRLWDPADEPLDLAAVFQFFREVLPDRPHQAVFLAMSKGEVVGMSALFVHRDVDETGTAKLGFGVRSAWTGKGIGHRLVETALRHAADRGLSRVVADVFPHNLRAIRLLTRFGFTILTPEEPVHEPLTQAVFVKTLDGPPPAP
ncbi:MAG: GNAT family N-acetyltransferase [Planctomycetota bacterium]|jgi:putative acetyltransferase